MDDISNLLDEHVQRDIAALRGRVDRMGGLVLSAITKATEALVEQDRSKAFRVVLSDQRIDAMEGHIDRLCQEFMVRHLPVAAQLRFVVSTIKINSELERIGDYAESIARRAVDLASLPPHPVYPKIQAMAADASRMLRQAVEAFVREDEALARTTLEIDREVNAAERIIHDQIYSRQLELDAETLHATLSVADRIERVADRACNICEDVVYTCTGEVVRHLSREDQRVLFLSLHNGFRTLVAEAVARGIAPAELQFRSAGLNPRPLSEEEIAAAARAGVDLRRLRAKSIEDAGRLEDFHLIVTFGSEAEEVLVKLPYKVIRLDWDIHAPGDDSPEDWHDRTCVELRAKVGDLIRALTGTAEDDDEREAPGAAAVSADNNNGKDER